MSDKKYHHGNLRNALIETGIKIIGTEGEENFSLRKLARECNVSNAAPYAHFSGKDEIIQAMQEHITVKMTDYLKETIARCKEPDSEEALIAVGRAYVLFFINNPSYFEFLFSKGMKVNLSICGDRSNNFPPFELFKEIYLKVNAKNKRDISSDEQELDIIHLWAYVHGIASIAFMKNVTWDKKWEDEIDKLIK